MGRIRRQVVAAAFLVVLALWASRCSGAERRPNFVFILADDLGYGDLGCYGQRIIRTPNIDRMAAEGVRFTDFYVCSGLCTPSRAGFLTGRYPVRFGTTRILKPHHDTGLPAAEVTLAEALRAEGYSTALVGKWHLGHRPRFLPTRHGFDRYFGIPYSNDMRPCVLMRGEKVIENPADQTTLTRRYTEEAVRFIRDSKAKPFFLYLAHTFPHVPLYCSPRFKGRSKRGLYGDVVEELDWSVGQVLAELKRLGLDGNTVVVFTSDNGPWLHKGAEGGSAGMLRSGKGTCFDGGVRVPCVVRWPGRTRPGRIERAPAIMLDWFPTFVGLAGGKLPAGRTIDGRDISPLLAGTGRRADEEFYFFFNDALRAHRSGPWKMKAAHPKATYWLKETHPELFFNIAREPAERKDVGRAQRAEADRLRREMAEFRRQPGMAVGVK